jgi:hypothetical protein
MLRMGLRSLFKPGTVRIPSLPASKSMITLNTTRNGNLGLRKSNTAASMSYDPLRSSDIIYFCHHFTNQGETLGLGL